MSDIHPHNGSGQRGQRIYGNSLIFLLYKALHDLDPQATLRMEHSTLCGYFLHVDSAATGPAPSLHQALRARMQQLVEADLPFEEHTMPLAEAVPLVAHAPSTHQLLQDLSQEDITLHSLDGLYHKFSSPLVASTGCLRVWDLFPFEDGLMLQMPDPRHPESLLPYRVSPKIFNIFQEHHRWAQLLQVPDIHALNHEIRAGRGNHLVHVAEALHEKKYASIADQIYQRPEVKMVLLAGPSSSGKTTSCRRLAVQLSVLGYDVHQLSLDDYFVSRERTPRDANGELDFECLEALDIPLLNEHLTRLFQGEEVELPTFDFVQGRPFFKGNRLCLRSTNGKTPILIVEGIHALNPKLTAQIDDALKFKVYVSALTQIAIDDHNIIHTSDNRLIRRIVRDNNYRGNDALSTLGRWESVRHGEELHIFPFQEQADAIFNSALLYELSILRPMVEPLLRAVPADRPEQAEAQRLLNIIELIDPLPTQAIPPTSILREFLGGSSFEY